jgi:vesicle coat complex subunit
LAAQHKKGEVNELKASLRNPAVERDPEKRREVVKRVIAYMTLGIDVSRLFTEMIMATSCKDLVVKKMVYLYICNYASTNPELSLLAINTLQKDCRDEDPMTRGLALRSFCSLRLPNIIEYLQKPVEDGLADPSAYVRKTAAMGVLKLHNLAPALVADCGLIPKLRLALHDRDATVVCGALCALEELEGRRSRVERALVHQLLNRMREFNEWAQVAVLGLVARYVPASSAETFDIMNLLEERLKHSNAAVVLATTKVFLNLTQDFPTVHQQVYTRLRTPLVTLVHGGTVEQGYATLKHICLLARRAPAVFAPEFKLFFCRFNEPTYVKLVKLEILAAIADARNAAEIVEEVAEYVTDVDVVVSKAAVRTIGRVGADVAAATAPTAEQLVALLSIGIAHVSGEAVVAIQTLLRKHPALLGPAGSATVRGAISTFGRYADEPDARTALLWILGEYGEALEEAPYLLEPMIDEFGEEASAAVRLELLSATVKLLLKRPAEVQAMAGRLLDAAVADTRFTEVHDRAIFYYRLLTHDVGLARRVLTASAECPRAFVEESASEWQVRIESGGRRAERTTRAGGGREGAHASTCLQPRTERTRGHKGERVEGTHLVCVCVCVCVCARVFARVCVCVP